MALPAAPLIPWPDNPPNISLQIPKEYTEQRKIWT